MESKIAEAISLKYNPVAIIWTDKKPENAIQFKKGGQGCVMNMLASAAKGRTAVFDRETFGCPGGGVGLVDISARNNIRQMGKDLMTFTVPFKMFNEMEGNIEGSFLQRELWKALNR